MGSILSALHNPTFHAALEGALAAAVVDYHAFLQFHSWSDVRNFSWGTSSFRWFQGAVAGIAASLMLPGVSA